LLAVCKIREVFRRIQQQQQSPITISIPEIDTTITIYHCIKIKTEEEKTRGSTPFFSLHRISIFMHKMATRLAIGK